MYIFSGYLDQPGVYTQEICSLNLETLTWDFISTKVSRIYILKAKYKN